MALSTWKTDLYMYPCPRVDPDTGRNDGGHPPRTRTSAAACAPFYLFKASDAPWLRDQQKVSNKPRTYVTDGPFLYKTKQLVMLWSSYRDGLYVETVAYSLTGKLRGPWRQGTPEATTADTAYSSERLRASRRRFSISLFQKRMPSCSKWICWRFLVVVHEQNGTALSGPAQFLFRRTTPVCNDRALGCWGVV